MPNIKISDLQSISLPIDGANTFFEAQTIEAGEDVSRKASLDTLFAGFGLDASFVTVTANASLPNERVLDGGLGIGIVDGGAGSTITVNMPSGSANDLLFFSGGVWAATAGGLTWDGSTLATSNAAGPAFVDEAASGANPTLIPDRSNMSTGIGHGAGNRSLSVILQTVEALRMTSTLGGEILFKPIPEVGKTAQAGGGQGGAFPIRESYSVFSTVASSGDSAILPGGGIVSAELGTYVYVKNDGANDMDVFPNVGGTITPLALNAAFNLPAGQGAFFMVTASNSVWTVMLQEGSGGVSFPLLAPDGTVGAPSYSFANDSDTGWYRTTSGAWIFTSNGANHWQLSDTAMGASGVDGAFFLHQAPTDVIPSIVPRTTDLDTGIGSNAVDELSLITGGVEAVRLTEVGGSIQILLPSEDDAVTPTLAFGDGDSGFYEEVDDTIAVALVGAKEFEFAPTGDPQFGDVELLTNQDGPDASTTFTEQSTNAAVATFVGNAQLDTAQFKFGTASLLLDGSGDYQHYPDNAAYVIGSNLFTIEGFVRFDSLPAVGGEMTMVSQWVIGGGADRAFAVSLIQDGLDYRIRFESEGGVGVFEQGGLGGAPNLNQWYHFAAQRSAGDTLSIWWDGVLEFEAGGIFTGSTINDSTTTLKLGTLDPTGGANAAFVDGWIDEVRITIGSTRYTPGGAITVPTSAFPTNSGEFTGAAVGAGKLFNQVGSLTSPTLVPRNDDDDTGIGGDGLDGISVIAGGVEGVRYAEASSQITQKSANHVGLTASVTQTQAGGLALLSSYNEIATVATTGDALTAFAVEEGSRLLVVNNGANDLQLFPDVGDNFGAGVDTAITIAAGETGIFLGRDGINWDTISTAASGAGTGVVYKFKAVSTGRANDTVLSDDPELFGWTIEEDEEYAIEGVLSYSQAGGDLKLTFQASTLLQNSWFTYAAYPQGSDQDVVSATDSFLNLRIITTIPDTGSNTITIHGYCKGPVSGNSIVDMQWAQNTSDPDDTTIGSGSWIRFEKISAAGGGGGGGVSFPLLAPDGSAAAPSYSFSTDSSTGLYLESAANMNVTVNGINRWEFGTALGGTLAAAIASGPLLINRASTAAFPNICPDRADSASGMGYNASGPALLANGVRAVSYKATGGFETAQINDADVGLTASTTQTQGNGALTNSYNEITIVANIDDTVTAPPVEEGHRLIVINNGIRRMQLFPASGDNIGAGVDTAIKVAAGESAVFFGIDATNWSRLQESNVATAVTTATQTVTNSTVSVASTGGLANVRGPGKFAKYRIDLLLYINGNGGGGGFRYDIDISAGSETGTLRLSETFDATSAIGVDVGQTSGDTLLNGTLFPATTELLRVTYTLSLASTTPVQADFTFQFAQQSANASGVTLGTQSHMIITGLET